MRPLEPPPRVGFRNIVAAEADRVADAVERRFRRTDGDEMQDDPEVFPPPGRHVPENAGTGEGGLCKMRLPRIERRPPPAQRLALRLFGDAGLRTARDRIRVDDVDPAVTAPARQGGLAAPVRASNEEESRHGDGCRPGQVDFRSPGASSTRSLSFVRAI